jgi:hypothetical protein
MTAKCAPAHEKGEAMKTGRYSDVVVEMVPRSLQEVCYRRTSAFVRAFDGTQYTLHDLAVWCYGQGVMDGVQMAESRGFKFVDSPEPILQYEI